MATADADVTSPSTATRGTKRGPRVRRPTQRARPLVLRHRRAILGVVSLALAAACCTVFATPYVVAHESMAGTLHAGEFVLVARLTPFGLARGDIVVFQPPVQGQDAPFVKRVIAIGGDEIAIRDGGVFVNGQRLAEPYLAPDVRTDTAHPLDLRVPDGSIFVLGDNRSISWDSRAYGPVRVSSVIGLAWLGYDVGSAPLPLLPPRS